jgi:hypothetical protein
LLTSADAKALLATTGQQRSNSLHYMISDLPFYGQSSDDSMLAYGGQRLWI